jgi:hypothetical protein
MGGGGTKVKYKAPKIPKDNTMELFLKYQQDQDQRIRDEQAAQEAKETAAAAARKEAGSLGYSGLRSGIEQQLRQGLIGYQDATQQLRDYAAKYDLTPPEQDVSSLTNIYTQELLPGRRKTGISSAYEEVLGRQATQEEQAKALERFNQGYYTDVSELRDSLYKSGEYQDKYNQSYLDNYYDTMFGKQTVDESGKKTGKRTFTFAKNLLPSQDGSLKGTTGITTPDFGDSFTGTAAEIEAQQQNVRDTRQYLYSAGLTNLQGEIDKQTQKLKNEGMKEVQKISSFGNVAANLVSGFWG